MNDGFLMEVPVLDQVRQDVKTELGVTPEHVNTLIMQSKQEAVEDPMIQQAKKNAMAIINADFTQSSERTRILKPIESFGLDTMQRSQQKNTLMKTTIGKLSSGGAEGGEVSRSLVDLNSKMKELDPGPLDFTRKGLFGSFFNPVRSYFQKFEKADAFIERILENMTDGQRVLQQDNVALQVEQGNLRELTKKLKREIEMGSVIDAALEEQIAIAKSQGADSEHIRFVEEEILFPLRQRVLDMQTLIAVNQQGVIAMELTIRNNRELIRGVDRARMVTVTALRTAVMVAAALYNQRIVLEKINALNVTTANLIAGTARMLKEQSTEINQQAMQSVIPVETLKQAFNDVFEATERISQFKQDALPMMLQQITEFREFADKGEECLIRIDKSRQYSLASNDDQ